MKNYNSLLNDLVPKKFNKLGVIWTVVLMVLIVLGIIRDKEITELYERVEELERFLNV